MSNETYRNLGQSGLRISIAGLGTNPRMILRPSTHCWRPHRCDKQ